ncbi:pyruvate formate lyase family protein [Gloeobacter kilaueensis]|uniref:Formate acetyltransferase n=1 Tax=Gloeobacter kilaueensis (strain ATCC BAA-2537 / CCAP 1431/1 / ULC 316 / JS1) TaxID=1183438 RepID=U5QSS8_GLOK1|nr:pyruvate formate lyase family protein [Gloeobacter kilaueensis]AGY60729.1 formate acetyltransferase [Gloeobacter kilaueensis JS1]
MPKPLPADPWQGFQPGDWQQRADVESFILCNSLPYTGDDSDLTGPTERTQAIWLQAQMLLQAERATVHRGRRRGGALQPDFLDRREELIFGMLASPGGERLPTGGDCRQLALYGARQLRHTGTQPEVIAAIADLARYYDIDIDPPAATAQQAIQWTFLALLATRDPLVGRRRTLSGLDVFFDIYLQRDLDRGVLIEEEAQELIDDLTIKLRLARPTGDAATVLPALYLPLAGQTVTRTGFRLVNTLYTLGPAAAPHLLVLWSTALSDTFRRFCAEVTIDTSSLSYAQALPLPEAGHSRTMSPDRLGATRSAQVYTLCQLLDALDGSSTLGINVLRREVLSAILARPNRYGYLTVQLPGGAVDLHHLNPAARQDVLQQLLTSFES